MIVMEPVSVDLSGMSIGERIRHFRSQKKMNQAELATALGIKQHAVSQIETNKRGLSVDVLAKAAGALGVSMDTLAGGILDVA